MSKKMKRQNVQVVQDCGILLTDRIATRRAASAAHLTGNPTPGREGQVLVTPDLSVAPDERALNPLQVGEMMSITPNSTRLSKIPGRTEIRIQEGDAPPRIFLFPYRVSIQITPSRRRAA